ncbi:beta-hexosaminidase [Nematostella vectensis]|uniref:beta-hexosaminidase n=1 Tax=Nematostella vectensis TaxID=45351 RepID=UPI0020775B3E|nr:beta-hexosaminidase [Nematostella vectensis]
MESMNMLLVLFMVTVLCCVKVKSISQDEVDEIGQSLRIKYDVLDNFIDADKKYLARVTLSNTGRLNITRGNWGLYFCSIRIIEPDHLPHNPSGYVIPGGSGIKVTHVNGCLHKLEPTSAFKGVATGRELVLEFKVKYFAVARTDIPPNWYIAAPSLKPQIINNTAGGALDFVGDFKTPRQYKRCTVDKYHPYSPEERYDKVDIEDLGEAPLLLVPSPVSITGPCGTSRVVLNESEWRIVYDEPLTEEAEYLAEKLNLTKEMKGSSKTQRSVIRLSIGSPVVMVDGKLSNSLEAYKLDVNEDPSVVIIGKGRAGVFYGIQTLLGIIDTNNSIPSILTIRDSPRYEYRGMHLDVGRNFKTKETVKRLLDAMATYKLNKFHFHLTEDEGWRLEIPGLEELTSVGSKRCHELKEQECLLPQLGSDPNGSKVKQFYSVLDYKEILEYAEKRHIEVIPEIDMPAHSRAAIKAMEARYQRFKKIGDDNKAQKYLLTEPGDPSRYISVQWFTDNAINPCMESTYTFVKHVVKEIVRMHQHFQKLKMFHFGGDEVAHGAWTNSTACKNFARRLGLKFSSADIVDKLKEYFVQRVANITKDESLDLGGWEDGMLGPKFVPYDRESIKSSQVFAYAWRGGGQRAYNLANAGYKVILSQATHLYFDHPYEPEPEERGYYWAARFTDTRKTFGYLPEDLYANVKVTKWGEPLDRTALCKEPNSCPPLNKTENILGMTGALWTETVRTADQMDSMVFPRLLALAERAWHKASWEDVKEEEERNRKEKEDWEKFANFLGYKELGRLDKMGIKYHIPVPGARVDGSKVKVRTVLPGLPVHFSTDGEVTWLNITDSTRVTGKVKLATRSADGLRLSRSIDFTVESSASKRVSNFVFAFSVVLFTRMISQ